MPGLAAYWPVLLAAILIGALVLAAIARELGARSRLSSPSSAISSSQNRWIAMSRRSKA